MTNYYELLEVANTASIEVIRAAYKAGVKRFHPDNYSNTKDKERATEHLKLLNEALEILTHETLRAQYDEELAAETNFFAGGNQRASTPGGDFGYCGKISPNALVESLIINCKSEAEYLDLRDRIQKGSAPETEKRQMLDILDEFTKVRLEQELEDESKLEEYRDEVKSLRGSMIFWLVVGFFLTAKFWWAFWVALFFCISGYCGTKDDRDNLKRAEYAVKHVKIYRMRGFKI